MKKFLIKVIAFLLIIIAFVCVLLEFTPVNRAAYMYEYRNKLERLDTLSEPRLILVGGSNLAFSIDSEMITDSLNINVANMGLHGSMGLRYMLSSILERVKADDIIVVMPEYRQFFDYYNGRGNILSPAFFYASDHDISNLNFEQISNIVTGAPSYITGNILFRKSDQFQYSADNFNEYGDEIVHRAEGHRKFGAPSIINQNVDEYALNDLAEKISELREKGCRVYLFGPNTIESNYLKNQKEIQEMNEALSKRDLYFSVSPDYFVQPDSMAFDTPYHLNGDGAIEAAKRFIEIYRSLGN